MQEREPHGRACHGWSSTPKSLAIANLETHPTRNPHIPRDDPLCSAGDGLDSEDTTVELEITILGV